MIRIHDNRPLFSRAAHSKAAYPRPCLDPYRAFSWGDQSGQHVYIATPTHRAKKENICNLCVCVLVSNDNVLTCSVTSWFTDAFQRNIVQAGNGFYSLYQAKNDCYSSEARSKQTTTKKDKKNADFSYTTQNMRKFSLETTFSNNRLCFMP